MQFANKPETVFKWVLNRPYQTKILESWVEMSGPSCRTTKNWRLRRHCALHFIYIFIVDCNFFARFCSSVTVFTRDVLPCT